MHDPRFSTFPTQLDYSDLVDPTPCLASSSVRPIGEATMSSVEQLGTDRWRARWRDPGGRQKAKTFTQKDFAAKWMTAQGHLKPSTRATYESILGKHVFPRWGSTPLSKVAHEDVAVWVSGLLESGLSPATVRYVHRVFSLLLDLAVRSSRIPRNPATGGANSREDVPEPSGSECSGPGLRRLPSRRLAAVVLRSPVGRTGGAQGLPSRSAAASTERCRGCQQGSRQADLGNT